VVGGRGMRSTERPSSCVCVRVQEHKSIRLIGSVDCAKREVTGSSA